MAVSVYVTILVFSRRATIYRAVGVRYLMKSSNWLKLYQGGRTIKRSFH
jgi:hypothetical protein